MEQNKDQGGAAVRGEAVAEAATDQLYGAVMNIPCTKTLSHFVVQSEFQAYKIGHRDARHAAADLIAAFSSSARAADAPSEPSNAIEKIFESWDGCDYDGIDIGAALRADFKNFVFGKSRAADALDSQPTEGASNDAVKIAVSALKEISEWRFGWDGDCGVTAVADAALEAIEAAQASSQPTDGEVRNEAKPGREDEDWFFSPNDGN